MDDRVSNGLGSLSMLEIKDLRGGWSETTVVDELSISVRAKETVAVLGRNGVGKTTLLELITGRCRRHSGRVVFDGKDISGLQTQRRAQLGIGYVPQTREVFPSLSVRENINVAARPGFWTESRLLELFPSLARRSGNFAGQLSGGEQQMLAIARALAGNPKLLLMDEPSEGLAPVVVEQLVAAMRELTTSGSLSIILVEQRADIGLELSDRYVVVDRGKIVNEGDSRALIGNDAKIGELIGLSVH
ncbi:ABC transporter ATP-binding protein [Rhizobium bangladeshense]|uniref:ABC transporter ATP-binding protein n=1 Tax=Rhizobium bangladeshense TaxID=1138189 RepID=UPI001FED31E1|nr:ABC transporter ATP-binding protein [Rhizobium bangladeshense]